MTEGERLQAFRKAKGFTQTELAEKTGINYRIIQAYEQDQRSLSRAEAIRVLRICKALGCNLDDILDD